MNRTTIKRLQRNPFYKLSDAQKKLLEEEERKPMIKIGTPPINRNEFKKHDVKITRRKI